MLAVSYMAGGFYATDHACSRAAIVIARSKKEMKRASIGPIRCFGVTKRFYDHQTWLPKLMTMSRRMFDKLFHLA